MRTIESVKLPLIDRIMKTNNEELLMAIDTIFKSTHTEDVQSLNSYQIEMLMVSENDIKQGNLTSEVDLKKADAEWMDLLCPRINW